jgi:cytoskeletal protein RodZ
VFEIGNSLREARKRQQLDLTDIEQATKIRARYLRALEEETFDLLPAQTYVKGFLRTYADYLGLDGQLYVDEYNSRYAVGEDEYREPVVARRSSQIRRHHGLERRGVVLALVGIAALFALVIAAWKFSGSNHQEIPNLGSGTGANPSSTHQKQRPRPARPSAQQQRPTRPKPVRVRLYLSATHGNCWMDVRNWSQNGNPRYTGTLELGQAKFFVARRLWINFGAPGNLSVALNGRPVTVPGDGTATIVLVTPHGITRATASA